MNRDSQRDRRQARAEQQVKNGKIAPLMYFIMTFPIVSLILFIIEQQSN